MVALETLPHKQQLAHASNKSKKGSLSPRNEVSCLSSLLLRQAYRLLKVLGPCFLPVTDSKNLVACHQLKLYGSYLSEVCSGGSPSCQWLYNIVERATFWQTRPASESDTVSCKQTWTVMPAQSLAEFCVHMRLRSVAHGHWSCLCL